MDDRETVIPNIGIVPFQDTETGKISWVDTSDKKLRKEYQIKGLAEQGQLKEIFAKSGVDFAEINTSRTFVRPLINLFKMREHRR